MNTLIKFLLVVCVSLIISACDDEESSPNESQPNLKLAPIANVGAKISTDENTLVNLDGSSSTDSDGSIVEYLWKQESGSHNVTINDDDQAMATFMAPNVDSDIELVFELTVTDNDGISSKDYLDVTILRVNQQPMVTIPSNLEANGEETVTMDGSGCNDPDGSIVSYAWSQTSGANVVIANANQSIASFTAPNVDAELGFQLTITDNEGATNTQGMTVTTIEQAPVIVDNLAPTANAGSDQSIDEKKLFSLNGSASNDPDGSIVSYSWTQTSGSTVAIMNASQAVASITAPDVETDTPLTFRLTVTDNEGATGIDTTAILIKNVPEPNQAPTAVTASNFSADENTLITLDGSASDDPDGTIVSYSWTQIAGSPMVAINSPSSAVANFISPEVTEAKTLTFELVVIDNDGTTATDTLVVTILDVLVNQPPIISGVPATTVTEDELYSFTPEATDPEDDTMTFSVSNLPEWASFDELSGTISGIPVTEDIGYYENIIISVFDGELSISLSEFSIDVLAAPVLIPENPLLSEVGSYSISMGTSQDLMVDRGSLGIESDTITASDLDAADTYFVSVKIYDADGNDLLESRSDVIGYRVYAGTTSDALYPVVELVGGSNSIFAINEPIESGIYYLSIVVFESTGYEGTLSDIIELNIM